ncbi:NAD(P)H-dependent oxidoreductase [Owenweeksia hongkongensis]|uniref:NAD(P)H-dependent oxidoreductase n=1 Tax=Owenweeksia hongkongensis TaxID=253245 RepID=UPI003A8FC37D
MQFIENLKWRYATKKFDPKKQISNGDLEFLKQAIQLSVSSYGLQLYKVLIIKDPQIRQQLRAASYNQSQITDASKLVVFAHHRLLTSETIDEFITRTAMAQGKNFDDLKGYGTHIKDAVGSKIKNEFEHWASKQTYLAMANLINACAELKIDACPMEGFDRAGYNKILGLDKQGLQTSVIAPIGYRSDDDTTQHFQKVRRPIEELFETI